MKRTLLAMLAALLALTVGAGLALVPSADAGVRQGAGASQARHKPVYWVDLMGSPSQHPRRVYFTANSGPYVKRITWTHWGRQRTVGHGIFGSTAPCIPGDDCTPGPATMWLRDPVRCTLAFGEHAGRTIRVYRHARIVYPDFEGGRAHANISDRAGWGACKKRRH